MFNNLKQKYLAWKTKRRVLRRARENEEIRKALRDSITCFLALDRRAAQAFLIQCRWKASREKRATPLEQQKGAAVDALFDELDIILKEETAFWDYVAPIQAEMNRRYGEIATQRAQRFSKLYDQAISVREIMRTEKL